MDFPQSRTGNAWSLFRLPPRFLAGTGGIGPDILQRLFSVVAFSRWFGTVRLFLAELGSLPGGRGSGPYGLFLGRFSFWGHGIGGGFSGIPEACLAQRRPGRFFSAWRRMPLLSRPGFAFTSATVSRLPGGPLAPGFLPFWEEAGWRGGSGCTHHSPAGKSKRETVPRPRDVFAWGGSSARRMGFPREPGGPGIIGRLLGTPGWMTLPFRDTTTWLVFRKGQACPGGFPPKG
jgi:hypothetical protein